MKIKIVLTLLAILSTHHAYSETTVNTYFNFYDIFPVNQNSLATEMDSKTPIVKGGLKYRGNTNWKVKWRFYWEITDGLCRVGGVNTELDITYTVPRLAPGFKVGENVKKAFDGYYAALMKHELGHGFSGRYAAQDIETTLLGIKGVDNCEELKQTANTQARGLIRKYNQRDIDYDDRTNHGLLEGVDLKHFIQ
ncbi:DUF922 domain-containing protein [Psychromonas sp. PT13]|uniref:DUF922 domain-containing protein n=1 Tax=Psychromonas sp. PT13 TaxID=3439547 RepID=UPI003EBEF438